MHTDVRHADLGAREVYLTRLDGLTSKNELRRTNHYPEIRKKYKNNYPDNTVLN